MNNLIKALRAFKELDPDSSVSMMLTFCSLDRYGFTPISEVVRRTGSEKSTVSRHLSVLSQYGRGKKEGLDLIRIYDAPSDRRHKIIKLTDKGKALMDDLMKSTAGN